MVRTTLLVARGGKLIVCMIYRPPGQNTAAGARAPERMTSGGPVLYVCMFVVHTGSSRTGGGERGRNTGRRKQRAQGRAQKRPACLPACLPAYRPGDFCSHARTHCSRPAYISVRFPSHEISRGWAHGASWLSTKDAGPRRQMRWMTGLSSSFSVTTFFTLNPHSPSPAIFKTWEHRGGVWVTWRDDG